MMVAQLCICLFLLQKLAKITSMTTAVYAVTMQVAEKIHPAGIIIMILK
jgi:hypothetical protein